jgi:hypothetical protein
MLPILVLLGLFVAQATTANGAKPFQMTDDYLAAAFSRNDGVVTQQAITADWQHVGPDDTPAVNMIPNSWGRSVESGRVRQVIQVGLSP